MIRLLRLFTPAQIARLLILREAYTRGLRCEYDRLDEVDDGVVWACDRRAVYVGPPSVRVEGER